ncbi:MAG: hypothetical protein ACFE9L_21855, partial [Candidatus Hodarchaeota archaeon]
MDPIESIIEQFRQIPSPKIMSPSEITETIKSILPIAEEFLENIPNNSFKRTEKSTEINEIFNIELPETSDSWEEIINFLKTEIIPRFPSVANPHFLAYIPSAPAPPAIIGALITPLFNQFVGTVIGSPGGSAIEGLAIRWITQLLDLDSSSF